jgi:hypothetical protein
MQLQSYFVDTLYTNITFVKTVTAEATIDAEKYAATVPVACPITVGWHSNV